MTHRTKITLCLLAIIIATLNGCSPKITENVRYVDRWHNTHSTDTIREQRTDSIYIRERGDTVFLEKYRTVYKDRVTIRTDTVVLTDSVQVVRQVRYVPPFYKRSTAALYILLAGLAVYIGCKLYRKFRLRL